VPDAPAAAVPAPAALTSAGKLAVPGTLGSGNATPPTAAAPPEKAPAKKKPK